jgi:oligoendopeptidase F
MKRQEIAENSKWRLEDIFNTDNEWEKAFENLKQNADICLKYKGNLDNAENIYSCLKDSEKLSASAEKLFAYAKMRQDEDTRDSKYKTLSDKIENLYVRIMSNNSFIVPALSKLPSRFLKELKDNPKFSEYDYFFRKLIENKKYILSSKEEKLLAEGGEIYGSFSDIFTMIDNADLRFPPFFHKGEKIQLSHAKYSYYMQSGDRVLRKKVFSKYYKAYINQIHTIAQVYGTSVKKDWYFSKIRGYKSSMEMALKSEDVSVSVYDRLIKSVNKNVKLLHAYMKFRKKALGLSKLHMYDLYVPIVSDAQLKLSYEEACDMVLQGLKPLGAEYGALLKKAMDERWIDVYENDGKRSGAYSMGVWGVHPYVLLNYEKTTHDVFTIAHELGHSLHTYYSSQSQPYSKADYTIFVAEVASTVNEVLLLKHIVSETKDKELKKYLLSYYLDMFRTTLFRQTLFSEFEFEVHKLAEENQPITHENASEIYLNLIKKYYGKSVIADDEIKYEWARIPHFYRNYYVYKYATGLTCAVSIAKMILEEGDKEVNAYINFLRSGGSDSPVELLKIAGVDISSAKPYRDAMTEFNSTLEELKSLYN